MCHGRAGAGGPGIYSAPNAAPPAPSDNTAVKKELAQMTALISVVVPVFNEAEGIRQFHTRATAALQALSGYDYELVYVDDGSKDASFEIMRGFADWDPRV